METERERPFRQSISKRKKRLREFGIEYKIPFPSALAPYNSTKFSWMGQWAHWKWYDTEEKRDQALAKLVKNENHQLRNYSIEYRAVNRGDNHDQST